MDEDKFKISEALQELLDKAIKDEKIRLAITSYIEATYAEGYLDGYCTGADDLERRIQEDNL